MIIKKVLFNAIIGASTFFSLGYLTCVALQRKKEKKQLTCGEISLTRDDGAKTLTINFSLDDDSTAFDLFNSKDDTVKLKLNRRVVNTDEFENELTDIINKPS